LKLSFKIVTAVKPITKLVKVILAKDSNRKVDKALSNESVQIKVYKKYSYLKDPDRDMLVVCSTLRVKLKNLV